MHAHVQEQTQKAAHIALLDQFLTVAGLHGFAQSRLQVLIQRCYAPADIQQFTWLSNWEEIRVDELEQVAHCR